MVDVDGSGDSVARLHEESIEELVDIGGLREGDSGLCKIDLDSDKSVDGPHIVDLEFGFQECDGAVQEGTGLSEKSHVVHVNREEEIA